MILADIFIIVYAVFVIGGLFYLAIKNTKTNAEIEAENDMEPGFLSRPDSLVYKGPTDAELSAKLWRELGES